jgi:23S rRNA (cytosine1962-C5)-methyltransferase
MKFLRLPDFLLSILFENEDIIAIDKPNGINTHTDATDEGIVEIFEKQLKQRLYVIHRLDQTTSGAIIFGKSPESAKKYAEFFLNREVTKTYCFTTASRSSQKNFLIEQPILQKGKEGEATTELKFLKKTERFELWQAHPRTGRSHQIRIHAKAAGIPILGDPKYGGAEYPFLCLHNQQMDFPNQLTIQSRLPYYFERLELLEDKFLAQLLFEYDRRRRLFLDSPQKNQCYRIAQLKDRFTIDCYGEKLVVKGKDRENKVLSTFASLIQKPIATEKSAKWVAREGDIEFEVSADGGLSLRQRLQTRWVLNNAKEKSVLNIFASTCGFSVAAALGGARQVVSVDSNKNLLNWGRRNFELNRLNCDLFTFLCRDVLSFLKQSISKGTRYDLIICDAPVFLRGEKKVFKIENDLNALLNSCLQSLTPQGKLLFSTTANINVQTEFKHFAMDVEQILPSLDFELPSQGMGSISLLCTVGTESRPREPAQS